MSRAPLEPEPPPVIQIGRTDRGPCEPSPTDKRLDQISRQLAAIHQAVSFLLVVVLLRVGWLILAGFVEYARTH